MAKIKTSWILSAALIVLVLFLFYRFGRGATGLFNQWFREEDFVDHPDTPVPDGPIDPEFDPAPYVARLQEVLQFLWDSSPRCDAYKRLLELTDAEFVIVCNAFKNDTGQSLRAAMDEQLYDGCNVFFNRHGVEVRRRMDALNVIG